MTNLLVVTTKNDLSIKYFEQIEGVKTDVMFFGGSRLDSARNYDVIYYRDPFVVDYDTEALEDLPEYYKSNGAYSIDHIQTLEDLLFEDKWRQYTILGDFMPKTDVLRRGMDTAGKIIKKRISSRGKAVLFDTSSISSGYDDYIVQDMMKIIKEYRVYMVCGSLVGTVSVKTSKTKTQKVKVDHTEPITGDVRQFCEQVSRLVPQLDLVGIDVARTPEGLRLIEINRAPQFKHFAELTGLNLAETLLVTLVTNGSIPKK